MAWRQVSTGSVNAGQQKTAVEHGGEISTSTRANGGASAPSVTQIFRTGPLADDSFWAAMGKGPEERRAALQRKTAEILSSPQLGMRRRWFMALLENYQSGDLAAVHAGMIEQEMLGGRFNKEYEEMMQRASEVDGAYVLGKIKKESGGPGRSTFSWQAKCMASWSGVDADKATAWWNDLPDGHFRDFLATPLIEGLARENPEKAWLAAMLFDPGKRAEFAATLVTALGKAKGPEGGAAWIASLGPEDAEAKARALSQWADDLHNVSNQKQADLMAQFAAEPWAANTSAFATMGTYWVMRDANSAIAWADALPEVTRKQTLSAVIKRWTFTQEDKAGAWVESQKGAPDFGMKSSAFLEQLRQKQSPALNDWSNRLGAVQLGGGTIELR